MRCIRCHRPMKHASASGMGRVCTAKEGIVIPAIGRDLFGYDVPAAAAAASERVRIHIEMLYVDACISLRHEAAAARRRLGIWA